MIVACFFPHSESACLLKGEQLMAHGAAVRYSRTVQTCGWIVVLWQSILQCFSMAGH